MTAVLNERLPPQPQSKALPTVQSTPTDIVATRLPASSRNSSKSRTAKARQDVSSADFTSRSATLSLIRRTLIADTSQTSDLRSTPKPIEGVLPPLTSSNEVDLQLYAVVAIIVKDFVNTWYTKLTPDHTFVEEIVQIIAHCSRAVEERIRHTDVVELILDELPVLLERHVTAYRIATSSSAQVSYHVNPKVTYHSLNPHPALEPVPEDGNPDATLLQLQNEAAYRQILVNGALAILLPTEDLQNAPLRILVTDIIADLIIGQAVAGKVCEGWFLYDAITKAIAALQTRHESKEAAGEEMRHGNKTRLEQSGLLNNGREDKPLYHFSNESNIAVWFWRIMQWTYLVVTGLWFAMQGILHAGHLPKRFRNLSSSSGSSKVSSSSPMAHEIDLSPQPVLTYNALSSISTLVRLRDRMPWLWSTMKFWQHVLLNSGVRIANTNSVLDRYLHHVLATYAVTSKLVVGILVGLRIGVFPNNSLGPPAPPPPSPEETLQIRRRAATAIMSVVPSFLVQRYLGSEDEEDLLEQIEEDILAAFEDKYMNKHLIYDILELILVRIAPELREAGVAELLAERGVGRTGGHVASATEVPTETKVNLEDEGAIEKKAEVIAGLSTKQ